MVVLKNKNVTDRKVKELECNESENTMYQKWNSLIEILSYIGFLIFYNNQKWDHEGSKYSLTWFDKFSFQRWIIPRHKDLLDKTLIALAIDCKIITIIQ